jgi:ATP-dependent RNA helicase DDX10/DBP4
VLLSLKKLFQDLGFKAQLDSIIEYLPSSRQTMLFSATQTKSVKVLSRPQLLPFPSPLLVIDQDLARLSLRDPEYLAVHADQKEATPSQLIQNYVVCPLHEKMDLLFSFIKAHLKSKIIVFMSTCSQVRYAFECVRGMQPGIPLIALHGKIKQERRTMVFLDFARRKSACLFATDIAARGLDFPDVDWVFQLDAPEDAAMYIHRVGRTARYHAGGRALLVLMPTEERAVLAKLEQAGVAVKKLSVNPTRSVSVASQAAALLVARPECRLLAKKAFTSYFRSLQNISGQNHPIDLLKLPVDAFAASLGLAITPPLPVQSAAGAAATRDGAESLADVNRAKKNVNRALDKLKRQIKEAKERKKASSSAAPDAVSSDGDSGEEDEAAERQKLIKMHGKKKARLLLKNRSLRPVIQGEGDGPAEDSEEELFTAKKHSASASLENADNGEANHDEAQTSLHLSKSMKRKFQKIRQSGESAAVELANTSHMKFDEEGGAVNFYGSLQDQRDIRSSDLDDRIRGHLSDVKQRIDAARAEDQERERMRVKEKHRKVRLEERTERQRLAAGGGAVLMNATEEESQDDRRSESNSDHDSDASSEEGNSTESNVEERAVSKKRKLNDKTRSNFGRRINEVEEQERLALELLEKA